MDHIAQNLKTIGGGTAALALYFVPTMIAVARGKSPAQVFLVNLFFGLTVIGWIVALIWSVGDRREA